MRKIGIKDLLEVAYAIEKSGYEIFRDLAKRHASNAALAKAFERLASEEETHFKKIEEYEKKYFAHSVLLEDLFNMQVVKEYFREFSHANIMKNYKRFLRAHGRVRSELEAVKLGLTLEMESIIFYRKFMEINKATPEVNALLTELVGYEIGHMETLIQFVRHGLS
jgi:rubrerythrin